MSRQKAQPLICATRISISARAGIGQDSREVLMDGEQCLEGIWGDLAVGDAR